MDKQTEKQRLQKLYSFEEGLQRRGCNFVAGIDEAGRGPLAGPLAVAAVILPLEPKIEGLNDSKKLKSVQRMLLYQQIKSIAISVSVWMVEPRMIDNMNIYQATIWGMQQAVSRLSRVPQAVITDAMPLPGYKSAVISLVKGDNLSASVAAASVVAKVERDRIMLEMDKIWPEYGFARHKGYATNEHLQNISIYGISPVHRRSFRPVSNYID